MKLDLYDVTLSASLLNITFELQQLVAEDEAKRDELVVALATLTRLAASMEKEVAVFRLGEAGQQARAILEKEATGSLNAMTADRQDKVIRPDFGGRS